MGKNKGKTTLDSGEPLFGDFIFRSPPELSPLAHLLPSVFFSRCSTALCRQAFRAYELVLVDRANRDILSRSSLPCTFLRWHKYLRNLQTYR